LGVVSLTVEVPQGDASEAEANQVGKEKTISSYGLLSDRPHDSTARNLRQQRASVDQYEHRL
jgi:hypothetical protein